MATWIEGKNGNKCSVEYFGTKESAQKALDSLKDCENCINCSRCSGCSGCSRCSRCSGCSGCSRCSDCSGLKNAAPITGNFKAPEIPVILDIHKRVYEAVIAPDHHLNMKDWHTCQMTHCRGGWVVTIAGEAGKKLESFHGTLLAAQLIYDASDPTQRFNPCRFFDSDEVAMEDMKRLAERA